MTDSILNEQHTDKIQYSKLTKQLQKTSFEDTANIEEFENKLEQIIKLHTKKRTKKHCDKPWWTDTLKILWKIKQEKQIERKPLSQLLN